MNNASDIVAYHTITNDDRLGRVWQEVINTCFKTLSWQTSYREKENLSKNLSDKSQYPNPAPPITH
jgi:hypothetical protein